MAQTPTKPSAKSKQTNPKTAPKTCEGKCPVGSYLVYFSMFIIVIFYSGYLYDTEAFRSHSKAFKVLQPFEVLFDAVEKYSPFHQFISGDNLEIPIKADNEKKVPEKEILLTAEELRKYDGSEGSPGTYLALLGEIFDVSAGKQYYQPGGGYSFFTAKDGSRAFVSGKFSEDGLTDNLEGLSHQDYLGLDDWNKFYHKDYKYVGKLIGRYYNEKGEVTEEWKKLQGWIADAVEDANKRKEEEKIFPPCNTEWSSAKGLNVWCTNKSGGIDRDWAGVPRRYFKPGRQDERCVCVKDHGKSLFEPEKNSDSNRGDLDNPNLKEYENCDPTAIRCQAQPPDNQQQ